MYELPTLDPDDSIDSTNPSDICQYFAYLYRALVLLMAARDFGDGWLLSVAEWALRRHIVKYSPRRRKRNAG